MELVKEFEKEYHREEEEEVRQQEAEENKKVFSRKIHGEIALWMEQQEIRQGILETNRGKLETVEEKSVL